MGDLVGFADLHAHLMGHLASGGRFLAGEPYDPDDPGPDGLRHALRACPGPHQLSLPPEICHEPSGSEQFESWPRYSTRAHQQAYVDWVKRAYEGGLRLVCNSAVNNELLAEVFGSDGPTDDKARVDLQLSAMEAMVAFVDRQAGGRGQGWLEIACSARHARQIVEADKLAVVLAVEVDSLGNWRTGDDLPADGAQARRAIRRELKRLYDRGVRLITLVHLTDNAFGGTHVANRFYETLNKRITGRGFDLEEASSGVWYRLEDDSKGPLKGLLRFLARHGLLAGVRRLLVGERGWRLLGRLLKRFLCARGFDVAGEPSTRGGQANKRGLTDHGRILLEEMMGLGMIFDLAHMSERTTKDALELAEELDYPVVETHTVFRELALSPHETADVQKVATEAYLAPDTVKRIRELGGMVAPLLYQGDLRAHGDRVANDCAGSSKSWAQAYLYAVEKMGGRGVALSTDVGGLAYLPGPRFGTHAASALLGDAKRQGTRRAQIEAQRNGVAYRGPLEDYRAYRWDGGGDDHSKEDRWTFAAIALAENEDDPEQAELSSGWAPEAELWIRNVAKGLRRGRQGNLHSPRELEEGSGSEAARLQLGAAYAAEGTPLPADLEDEIRSVFKQVRRILDQVDAMTGPNEPKERCRTPQRDFDINIDGVAHYGLLPDLICDLSNIGLTDADLAPLFSSAEHFIGMWEKCEQQVPTVVGARRLR